ncbi:MAG: hypothetical protein ACUVWP_04795 [bacterium]
MKHLISNRKHLLLSVIVLIIALIPIQLQATTIRIKGGTYFGISSSSFISHINSIAEGIPSKEQLNDYGMGLNIGFDLLYGLKKYLIIGPTFFIETSNTSRIFNLPGDNSQERFYTSATLGCVGARLMFRLPYIFEKYPYVFTSSGLAIGYLNMEDYPNKPDIQYHFPYGYYTWYKLYISVGGGYSIPIFNLGNVFAQIEYIIPLGKFIMDEYEFRFRGLDISGGYSREF